MRTIRVPAVAPIAGTNGPTTVRGRWPRSPRLRRAVAAGWVVLLGWSVGSGFLPALHRVVDTRPMLNDEVQRMQHELTQPPMGTVFQQDHPAGTFRPPSEHDLTWLNDDGPYRSMAGAVIANVAALMMVNRGLDQPASPARTATIAAWQAYGETAVHQAQLDRDRSVQILGAMDGMLNASRRFSLYLMPRPVSMPSDIVVSMTGRLAEARYSLWHPQTAARAREQRMAWINAGPHGAQDLPPASPWDGLSATEKAQWADPAFHPTAEALR